MLEELKYVLLYKKKKLLSIVHSTSSLYLENEKIAQYSIVVTICTDPYKIRKRIKYTYFKYKKNSLFSASLI